MVHVVRVHRGEPLEDGLLDVVVAVRAGLVVLAVEVAKEAVREPFVAEEEADAEVVLVGGAAVAAVVALEGLPVAAGGPVRVARDNHHFGVIVFGGNLRFGADLRDLSDVVNVLVRGVGRVADPVAPGAAQRAHVVVLDVRVGAVLLGIDQYAGISVDKLFEPVPVLFDQRPEAAVIHVAHVV